MPFNHWNSAKLVPFFATSCVNICLLYQKSAEFAPSFANGSVNICLIYQNRKNSRIFHGRIFEMHDFCLNWLTHPFCEAFFFSISANFLKCTIFYNCFLKYAIILPTIFKFCPFILLTVEKWNFFVDDFFKCVIWYVNMQLFHPKSVNLVS